MQKITFVTRFKNLVDTKNIFLFYSAHNKLIYQSIKKKIKSFSKFFLVFIKLEGVGFKVLLTPSTNTLVFFFGFSHWVSFLFDATKIKIFVNQDKTILKLFTKKYNSLAELCFFIQSFKKPNVYKKKGIFLFNYKLFKKNAYKNKQIKKK